MPTLRQMVEILLVGSALGNIRHIGINKNNTVHCDLRQSELVSFGPFPEGNFRVNAKYRIRPFTSSKNRGYYRNRIGGLLNIHPERGAAEVGVFCAGQKNRGVTKLLCKPDGTAALLGDLPICEAGCDPTELDGFDTMTSTCRRGLKTNGREYDGNRCRRTCSQNSNIETAKVIYCRCSQNGRNCKYNTRTKGRYRLFDSQLLREQCMPDEKSETQLAPHIHRTINVDVPATLLAEFIIHDMITFVKTAPTEPEQIECGPKFNQEDSESGCWELNENLGRCEVVNPACYDLTCSEDAMSGFIRSDMFASLVTSDDILLNQAPFSTACRGLNAFRPHTMSDRHGFLFNMKLGDCEMDVDYVEEDSNKYIQFSQSIAMKNKKHMSLRFDCLYSREDSFYQDEATVDSKGAIRRIASWEKFDLAFGHERLNMGDEIVAVVTWQANMATSDVVWYLDKCTVISGEKRFDVVQDGCYSDFVNTRRDSTSTILARSNFIFRFKSFSFEVPNATEMVFRLECKVHFCLSDKPCDISTQCPAHYHLPL